MILFLLLLMATRCVGFLLTPVIIIRYYYYNRDTRFLYTYTYKIIYNAGFRGRCSSLMTGPVLVSFFVPIRIYLIVNFRCTSPRQRVDIVVIIIISFTFQLCRRDHRCCPRAQFIYHVCVAASIEHNTTHLYSSVYVYCDLLHHTTIV